MCTLFSGCSERGLLSSCTAWAYCRCFSCCGEQALGHMGSVIVAPGFWGTGSAVATHALNCSVACGIFLDQGSNLCLLLWQADSLPMSHQESLKFIYIYIYIYHDLYLYFHIIFIFNFYIVY